MNSVPRYFDFNATTPMSEAASHVWLETSAKHWQNPSSLYRESGEARRLLDDYREQLADYLMIENPERVIFTSGATESNNAVIRHLAVSGNGVLAVSGIEHPCVEAPVEAFFPETRIRRIPVDAETGVIDLAVLETWIRNGEVGAVSVMAANNETGALQPWQEISRLCRESGLRFHSDAAQWIGKCAAAGLDQCDFVTGSGHKFNGGKGVGFLLLPEDFPEVNFHSLIGGPQEEGRRAGTENLPGIAAMVTALLERGEDALGKIAETQTRHRARFEDLIHTAIGCRVLAAKAPRLWNTSMFVLPHAKNLKWLTRLSQQGFCVSTGSACSAGKGNPSSVMMAMGLDFEEMGRVIRVSGGWETEAAEWDALAAALLEIAATLEDQ